MKTAIKKTKLIDVVQLEEADEKGDVLLVVISDDDGDVEGDFNNNRKFHFKLLYM